MLPSAMPPPKNHISSPFGAGGGQSARENHQVLSAPQLSLNPTSLNPDPLILLSTLPELSPQPFPFTPAPPPPPPLAVAAVAIAAPPPPFTPPPPLPPPPPPSASRPPPATPATTLNRSHKTPHLLSHPGPACFLNRSSASRNNTSCLISGHSHSSGWRNPHTTHTRAVDIDMFGFAGAVAFVPAVAVAAGAVPGPEVPALAVGGTVGGCRGRWLGTVGARIGVGAVAVFVLLLRR